jgi:hypothetical protein
MQVMMMEKTVSLAVMSVVESKRKMEKERRARN